MALKNCKVNMSVNITKQKSVQKNKKCEVK